MLKKEMAASKQNSSKKVLLLLSGGKDSPEALRRLLNSGYRVHALCIDGIQGKEKIGAVKAAREYGIPIDVVQVSWFDENTWNPFLLIKRDIAMVITAVHHAKKIGASAIATGVKKSDLNKPLHGWLMPFISFCGFLASFLGLSVLHPVWEWTCATLPSAGEKKL